MQPHARILRSHRDLHGSPRLTPAASPPPPPRFPEPTFARHVPCAPLRRFALALGALPSPDLLPPLLRFNDGREVRDPKDWKLRRQELQRALLDYEYGVLPPAPPEVRAERWHGHSVARYGGAHHAQCRLSVPGLDGFSFRVDLWMPPGDERAPVVLTGDGCWCYLTDQVTAEVLNRGYVLAVFSRVELAPDDYNNDRTGGIYPHFSRHDFGAIAAWAWGYHRVVDFLVDHPRVDATRIAIVGHSRGGKATLLAGATDERIALVSANGSGTGGAAVYRHRSAGAETLEHMRKSIPYWFKPSLFDYVGREAELPFDQHALLALIAPRALLLTEANEDAWANLEGTALSHRAAGEVYKLLGAERESELRFREGRHAHTWEDWVTFLNFADARLRTPDTAPL